MDPDLKGIRVISIFSASELELLCIFLNQITFLIVVEVPMCPSNAGCGFAINALRNATN